MSWHGLEKPTSGRVIRSSWGRGVVEALDILYYEGAVSYDGLIHRSLKPDKDLLYNIGFPDARIKEVHAGTGYFSQDVFIQGKRAIKDGDPVNIYDIFEPAREKITLAIDYSKLYDVTGGIDAKLAEILQRFDVRLSEATAREKITQAVDYSKLYDIATGIDAKLAEVSQRFDIKLSEATAREKFTQAIDYSKLYSVTGDINVKLSEILQRFDVKLSEVKSQLEDKLYQIYERLCDVLLVDTLKTERTTSGIKIAVEASGYEYILQPTPGRRISTRSWLLHSDSTSGIIKMRFPNSGKILGALFCSKQGFVMHNACNITGYEDEPVLLEWSDLAPNSNIFYQITFKEE